MKKLLIILISSMFYIIGVAQKVTVDGVTYKIMGNKALISSIDKKIKKIKIYGKIKYKGEEYPVTGTSGRNYYYWGWTYNSPFSKSSNLETIIVDSSFDEIDNNLFYGVSNVKEIILPPNLKKIASSAFSNCSGLRTIIIPNGIKRIEDFTFSECRSLRDVYIPPSVTVIASHAFSKCTSLESIVIPSSVKVIDLYAFSDCSSLQNVIIPNSAMRLYDVFQSCNSIANISDWEGNVPTSIAFESMVSKGYDSTPLYKNNNQPIDSLFKEELLSNYFAIFEKNNGTNDGNQSNYKAPANLQTDNLLDIDIPSVSTNNGKTFAVIIGNENYTQVAKVPYAQNDARIFAEYCKKTLGLPEKNVKVYENATYGTMIGAVSDIQKIAKAFKGDITVIFYYAGHGIPDEATGDGYLLPIDADGLKTEVCYPLSRLYREFGELGAKSVVAFMDACFSGAQRGNGMVVAARGVAIKAKSEHPTGNTIVFTAATDKQTAYPYEEKGHGMFTYYLLKKLRDTKGDCTLGELGSYICDEVPKQAVVTNGKEQTPVVLTSDGVLSNWQGMKLK